VLTKISVTLYAGGIVMEVLVGIDFWTGALIIVAFTGLYTIAGGLRAVLYTDMVQMIVLVVGAAIVTVLGFVQVGGWSGMLAEVPDDFMSMWQPMDHEAFPWTGILFGAPILAVWYWCTDQYIVQRTLAARDDVQARRGAMFAGYLKLLPVFIFVIPGVVVYALVQQGEMDLDRADDAFPALIGQVLPIGVRGLVVAALLAALMSSLSSVFNSTATLVTWDLYKTWRPESSDRHLVWVGRISTAALTVVALAWIPFMEHISPRLYEYLQAVQSYISPPIAAVFILGIAWRRINATGAITSLLFGLAVGSVRMVVELLHGMDEERFAGVPWLVWFAEVNFLHVAIGLFVACVLVLVVVSLLTGEPTPDEVAGLTYATVDEEVVEPAPPGAEEEYRPVGVQVEDTELRGAEGRGSWDVILVVVLIGCVVGTWLLFA
jgi:solute:Na+ symporter, SSS family